MIALAALAIVAAMLLAHVVRLHRRLELVARAEHELRGPLGALALGLHAALGGASAAPELLPGLELQLARARSGLADLAAAREGRRAAPQPRLLAVEPFVRAAAMPSAPPIGRAPSGGTEARAAGLSGPPSADRPEAQAAAPLSPPSSDGDEARALAVRIDPGRLAQALGNLVDNALEHGGGSVEVRSGADARTVRLEVADRGAGSPIRHPSRAQARAGRGRGLAIATRAVEEAGGRLDVRFGPGGAVVGMELPRAEG